MTLIVALPPMLSILGEDEKQEEGKKRRNTR